MIDIYGKFNEINSICTPEFIGQLNNSLAHFTMLDSFLALGFNVDDFLQNTPKKYLIDGMLMDTAGMVLGHKVGTNDTMQETRDIVLMCASAKLFEMYKTKDPNTQNGVHSSLIMNPLKEINPGLVNGLDTLFNEWRDTKCVDNLQFYSRLTILLTDLKIIKNETVEPAQPNEIVPKEEAGV